MERKPLIVITMGDPAGIGPEIAAKVFAEEKLFASCRPVLIGDAGVMAKAIRDFEQPVSLQRIDSADQAEAVRGMIPVLDLGLVDMSRHAWGNPGPASGTAVVEYIKRAVQLALTGRADAIVTAPISKAMMNAAGHRYPGHTELLAELTGSGDYGMLFVGGGLRVILATIHLALKDVPRHITTAAILKTIRLAQTALHGFGIERPRIGLAALNPHAGEGSLFGREEQEQILPAVLKARAEGIRCSDPLPADTLFYKARNGEYDVVVAMYHDQGLAPLKMIAFGNSVNVTVGLPIIRTSVDHGTAYDIAGKGCADPASLLQAALLAAEMAAFRKSRAREET
jgi:4-hydroxythreonine-4-phosphate dehydrogenase